MSKKRKFTFNVIDALIILILVAIITFVVYFFVLGKDFNGEKDAGTEVTKNTEQSTINQTPVSSIHFVSDENIVENLL